jgi:hypothetical protein
MEVLQKIDFAKGLKTLVGIILLSIPYLDGILTVGSWTFDIPDGITAILATPEVVAVASGLVVYGGAMRVVRFLQKYYSKK